MRTRRFCGIAALLALPVLIAGSGPAVAGPLRERIAERRIPAQAADEEPARLALPGVRVLREVPYGTHPRQRFDVYLPPTAVPGAPVLLMVHGGGWAHGDKAMRAVVENKAARWVAGGALLVSTNYRLLPEARPVEQARDVARALAAVQAQAAQWGGDGARVVLIGHSAGAHLVSLLAASPTLAREAGAAPWLGTVALDSAGFDLVRLMRGPHLRLYDQAFGDEPEYWRAASPLHQLRTAGAPLLAVCSSRRRDHPCAQAEAFAVRGRQLGMSVEVLPQPLSHGEINQLLGADGAYTQAVDAFLGRLDARFSGR